MKCSNCCAENPDYAFYCGRCAAELRVSSAASAPVVKYSEVTNEIDKEKWTFRWRASGAVELVFGVLGLVSYGYTNNLAELIWGIIFIAGGLGSLFIPVFEREE